MIYHKSKNCASRQDFRSFQSVAQRLAYREQESAVIEAWTCGRQARNYTHQPTKIAFWYFRTAMKEHIRRAVVVLRDSPALSDGQILRNLVESGMERVLAARFMVFLPMAYCRLILRASGARFSDTFRQVLPDGGICSERSLSSELLWEAAVAFARTEVEHGVPGKDLLVLAARSAEFDAANHLLNRGAKLSDLAFAPPLLPFGPMAARTQKLTYRGMPRASSASRFREERTN